MFRKTISPLWLVFFLLPQLSSAEDLISEKQSSEIFQESVEIEGDSLETLLDRKMKAKGNKKSMVIEPMSEKDIENMKMVVRMKFDQNPVLKSKLKTMSCLVGKM